MATPEALLPATLRPTRRQLEIHAYMLGYLAEHRRPPTFREIGEVFRIGSTNGVSDHLKSMMKKGLVTKGPGVRCYVPVVPAGAVPPPPPPPPASPWDACDVVFGVDDPAALSRAELLGRLVLPDGWTFTGVSQVDSGKWFAAAPVYPDGRARPWAYAAIFGAPPSPSVSDGARVLALLRALGARP